MYFLYPLFLIGVSTGFVVYWHYKRRFTKWILLYSFIAYFGAFGLKEIVQIPTINAFKGATGGNLFALGVYYGLQTVFLEVSLAYVVATLAVKRNQMKVEDAESYGLGLGIWENGVLIAFLTVPLSIVNLLAYYSILSSGGSLGQLVYSELLGNFPSLFYPPSRALPIIGLALVERASSFLAHFSWGYLCVLAAAYKKRVFVLVALPMGLVDFLVPFASSIGVARFEVLVFAFSLLSLAVTFVIAKGIRKKPNLKEESVDTHLQQKEPDTR